MGTPISILLLGTVVMVVGCARAPSPPPVHRAWQEQVLPRPSSQALPLFVEPFDQLDPARWRAIDLNGRTEYTLVTQDGSSSVKAQSDAGASILLHEVRFRPDKFEWLSWRWRVDQLVSGEDLAHKDASDAAARIYVYFDTPGLPWQKRAIQYVWSATLPVGTVVTSPYPGHPKMIVVESGPEHLGTWREASRNLEDDYEQCYGGHPPRVVAIGLMTDTDNTKSEAVAYYDDLRVTRQPPESPAVVAAP